MRTSMLAASACECPGITGTPPGLHGVLQGPLRCRGGEGPWESQAAFKCNYCHFSTVKPPPEGSKSCFQDWHTEAHLATHWCDSQPPSVGSQGRGRCGSWCSTFPEQRLPPPRPHVLEQVGYRCAQGIPSCVCRRCYTDHCFPLDPDMLGDQPTGGKA